MREEFEARKEAVSIEKLHRLVDSSLDSYVQAVEDKHALMRHWAENKENLSEEEVRKMSEEIEVLSKKVKDLKQVHETAHAQYEEAVYGGSETG
jgi:alpha-glucuronidase